MNACKIYLEKAEKSECMLLRWIYEVTLWKTWEVYKSNRSRTRQPYKATATSVDKTLLQIRVFKSVGNYTLKIK